MPFELSALNSQVKVHQGGRVRFCPIPVETRTSPYVVVLSCGAGIPHGMAWLWNEGVPSAKSSRRRGGSFLCHTHQAQPHSLEAEGVTFQDMLVLRLR